MKLRGTILIAVFATFGTLTMSCNEEEVNPKIENSLQAATEGNNGGHDEPPVETDN